MKTDAREKLNQRVKDVMNGFESSIDNIKMIISMNNGLYARFRMAYDDLMKMKRRTDDDIRNGRLNVSNYMMFPEYFFGCNYENGIPTAKGNLLMEINDESKHLFPSCTLTKEAPEPDFERDFLHDDLNTIRWNNKQPTLTGIEKPFIHEFMFELFIDSGTFCLADIPYLRPEDLRWQITVKYEFFTR